MAAVLADGTLAGRHRKLMPTNPERMVWGMGDASGLRVVETPAGRLGSLICWENYMPLARYALYAWGTQIYVAATWDRGDTWLATIQHVAKEGGVYLVSCCTALRSADIPEGLRQRYYSSAPEWINVGRSAIVDPTGRIIAGPAEAVEEILYADVDLAQTKGPRWMLDVAGHYARPDIFQLTVRTDATPMLRAEASVDRLVDALVD